MSTPTDNTAPTAAKPRGPRVFKPTESFNLVLNHETGNYDLSFEGKQYEITFVAPESFRNLVNPLAAGMKHTSGRHTFTLGFKASRLVSVINDNVDAAEGEQVKLSQSVQVGFDSPIKDWIRVLVELPVEKALRLK